MSDQDVAVLIGLHGQCNELSLIHISDKPLIILLTHTHFDHDGGVFEFPGVPVYVNPLDGERAEEDHKNMEKFMGTAMMKSTMVMAAEKPLQKVARYSRPSTGRLA